MVKWSCQHLRGDGRVYLPLPWSRIACGLLKSLFTTLAVPVRVPACEGVKVTLTVQEAPGTSVCGQLLLAAKSPVAETGPIVKSETVEGLLSFTVMGLLVVPTA